ncbi:DUF2062 domain-containing protein [Rosistilla carotiformis]|nr:DUF2062 domain-containing protein [Rosistilla carotiformis]
MHRYAKRQSFRIWIRIRRYVMHNILHADDPPHPLALGVAIGLFVTFTPTIGLQMLLVMLLAWALRANKVVGIPIVWLSNPATFVPIYLPCYQVGRLILGSEPKGRAWWHSLQHPPKGFLNKTEFYWTSIWEIIGPLTIGCLVVASVVAVIGYCVTYSVIYTYRMKRFGAATPPQD